MTKTRFIGDVHGLKYELGLVIGSLPENVTSVIQLGDMGVGFGQGNYWHESLDNMMERVNGRFIRGNHDNPAMCKTMKTWISDGLVENDVMFVGGAWSIDYQRRTLGYDLWDDEELSYEELNRVINIYDMIRPRIMVTHDCPLSVSNHLFIQRGKSFSNKQYRTRTGSAFEAMFEIHKPDMWIFGHWHYNEDEFVKGIRFICLDEMSYADVNLDTLEVYFPDYQNKLGKM